LILDTDPLMTAAWAQMLFGQAPQELFAYPKADLYLLFSPDVPWVADGTRFFGSDEARARFAAVSEDMLVRAGVCYARIDGDWDEREAQAVEAIDAVKVKVPPAG
jgi:nicotinamide riboside kinase